MTSEQLLKTANSLSSGHLKEWKAQSMIRTLDSLPMIKEDPKRFRKWISNCLEMEGYVQTDIDVIIKAFNERSE